MRRFNPKQARMLLVRTAVLGSLAVALAARAATLSVSTTDDIVGADGKCSLREAISNVNTHSATVAGAGECAAGNAINDTIVLPAGTYVLGILGAGEDNNASGDLDIRADVNIEGAGSGQTIVDGNGTDRVFDVPVNGLTITLQDLTVANGHLPGHRTSATAIDRAADGGGMFMQNGTLGLLRVAFSANQSGIGSPTNDSENSGGDGGAIFATSSTLNILDSTFAGNRTGVGQIVGNIDGYGGNGGAIFLLGGTLLIQGSKFSENKTADGTSQFSNAGSGGAIATQTGSVTIEDSAFDGNAAGSGVVSPLGFAGALYLASINDSSSITRSSITRNSANIAGGILISGGLHISNTTISDNAATTRAGGVYLDSVVVQFDFVTVTENTAPAASGIYVLNTYYQSQNTTAQANLRNTIASHNPGANACATGDAHSFFSSQGHNVVGNGCPSGGVGDIASTAPHLTALSANGGVGLSRMPDPTSPATDAGSCAASGIDVDQRGHARPADLPRVANVADGCDIGAVEFDDDVFWDGFGG